MKPSAGYLIPRTSAEELWTSLLIQTQTLGRISTFSAESLNPRPRVSDLRPDIWIWDIRQHVVISHGTLRHGFSPVNLLHIFGTPFLKNTSRRLLLFLLNYHCLFFQESNSHYFILQVRLIITSYIINRIFRSTTRLTILVGEIT